MKSIKKFTAEELAAQCIIARINPEKFHSDLSYKNQIIELVQRGICGFCVFEGTSRQVLEMTEELQGLTEIPLFFAADFEHGLRMRLSDGSPFPHAMAIGKSGNIEDTYEIAKAIAIESKYLGINWNFAPVCDVNSNQKNPIINIRAFGDTPEIVIKHAVQYIKGIQSEKVLSCAKHFPGHGDTDMDSHLQMPILNKSIYEIEKIEIKPFVEAIKHDVKSIMLAHLNVPTLDENNIPSSLSKKIVTGILRNSLNFNGLIITDALDMKAISDNYSSGNAAVLALKAGCNIALMPENPLEAINTVALEIENDIEFRNTIISSLEIILSMKRWAGLTTFIPHEIPASGGMTGRPTTQFYSHEKLALKVAFSAIEIHGNASLIPIKENIKIAAFAIIKNDDFEPSIRFFNLFTQAIENDCDLGFIDSEITGKDIDGLKENITDSKLLIFAIFNPPRAYKGNTEIPNKLRYSINRISSGRPKIIILFGNPYIKDDLDGDLIIDAFSDSESSMAAAVLVLSGRNLDNYI